MEGRNPRQPLAYRPRLRHSVFLFGLVILGGLGSDLPAQESDQEFARLEAWLQGGESPRAVQVLPLRRDEAFPEPRLFTAGSIGSIVPVQLGPDHRVPLGRATSWLRKVTTDTILAQQGWSIDSTLGECLPARIGELPDSFADLRWRELRDGTLCLATPYGFELAEDEEPRPLSEVLTWNIHLRSEDPWNFGPSLSPEGASAILQWALEAATESNWGALIREGIANRLRLPSLRGLHSRFEPGDGDRLLFIEEHEHAHEVAAFADASIQLRDLEGLLRQWIRTEPMSPTRRRTVLDVEVIDSDFSHFRVLQLPSAGLAVAIVDPEGQTGEAVEALLIDLGLAEDPSPEFGGWNSAVGLGGGSGRRFTSSPPEEVRDPRDCLRLPGRYEAEFRMLDGEHRIELSLPIDPEEDIRISVDGQGRPPSRLRYPESIGGLAVLRTRPGVLFHEWRGELRGFAQDERSAPARSLSWAVTFRRLDSSDQTSDTRWLGGTEIAARSGLDELMGPTGAAGAARLVAVSQLADTWFGTRGRVGVEDGEAFDETMPIPLGTMSRVLGFLADETLGHRHDSRLFWQRAADGLSAADSLDLLKLPRTGVGPHERLTSSWESFANLVSQTPSGQDSRSALDLLRRHALVSEEGSSGRHQDLELAIKQALYESGNVYRSFHSFLNDDLAKRYGLGRIEYGATAARLLADFRFRRSDGRLLEPASSEVPLARGLVTDAATLVRATRSLYDGSLPSWYPSRPRSFDFHLLGPNGVTQATFFFLRDDDPNSTRRVLFCHELDLVIVVFAAEEAEDWADDIEQAVLEGLVPGHALPRYQAAAKDSMLSAYAPVRPTGSYRGSVTLDGQPQPIRFEVTPDCAEVEVTIGEETFTLPVTGAGLTRIRLEGEVRELGRVVLEVERLRFSERLRAQLALVNDLGGRWPVPIELSRSIEGKDE